MAVGDTNSFAARLRSVLPNKWFSDDAPVLLTAMQGFGSAFAAVFDQIAYTKLQTRLQTSTDDLLDLAASDYFANFPRRLNEPDAAYSLRIRKEIIRPRNTRAAIIQVLQDLTGNTPAVFRPSNTADTGGWNTGALGYAVAGGYGSLALPFQAFVTIDRGTAPGAGGASSAVNGQSGWGSPLGGYGVGAIGYGADNPAEGGVTDSDIYEAVASVTPAGHVNWVKITGADPLPLPGFIPSQTQFPFFFAA